MASEKAKALAAKQKAELKAAKQAKKNSDNPADWGRIRQVREAYRVTREFDPQLPWWMLGSFVVPIVVFTVLALVLRTNTLGLVLWILLGITTGMLVAMLILVRRMKASTYKRYEGQAGSAQVALQMLPKQWMSAPMITFTKQQDIVHRALGPGGLILIGEGDANRLKPLLASEARKHEGAAYGVKVQTFIMGEKNGQVPLAKLTDTIKKLPKQLEANQITEINARLRALDAVRPKMPIPKGPMNVKGARKAMRGR